MTPVLATQILRDDHKRLIGLFRQFEAIGLRAQEMKQGVANEIFMELEIHSAIEEQIFYPALLAGLTDPERQYPKRGTSPELFLDAPRVDSGIREHLEMRDLLQRLRLTPVEQEEFQGMFDELVELVESHLTEEEQITLPAAEQLLRDDLSQLGAQMQDLRDDLLRMPQYRFSLPGVVQNPNGGEQKRKRTSAA